MEHALFHSMLRSFGTSGPGIALRPYIRARTAVGLQLYASRFCPVPSSPNRLIAKLLVPGAVCIDVGASAGEMTMLASARVGGKGEVHSFEPLDGPFRLLHAAVRLGGLSNVRLNQSLLAEQPGILTIYQHPASAESSVSKAWRTNAELVAIERPATSLDAYWTSVGSGRAVDLIKIDVEGFELPVLRGAASVLRSYHPQLILEIADGERRVAAFGYSLDDLMRFLGELGYGFAVPRGFRVDRVATSADLRKSDTDMLCVHPGGALGTRAAAITNASLA